jgi:acyl-CoA thioester hydrolase
MLRSLGLTYSQLEIEQQLILPVVEATCRYRAPARYDDEILIETRPALLRGSVLKFAYRILRKAPDGQDPAVLAEGETVHVVCDGQLNKKPLPEPYAAALRAMIADG